MKLLHAHHCVAYTIVTFCSIQSKYDNIHIIIMLISKRRKNNKYSYSFHCCRNPSKITTYLLIRELLIYDQTITFYNV